MTAPGDPHARALPGTTDGPPPASGSDGPDWPVEATRSIVKAVDTVRDKTSGPAITAVAAMVYGIVALTALTVLTIVLTAATIRGLELLLWRKVWLAYLVLSVLLFVGGLVCWSRRATVPD
jgi:hypothetical protein